jgi:hypothetical protein
MLQNVIILRVYALASCGGAADSDMSAMSITHKTVGIRLSRLWCGAIEDGD